LDEKLSLEVENGEAGCWSSGQELGRLGKELIKVEEQDTEWG